jgi:hypothetical protein
MMAKTISNRNGRCLCGVRISLHFDKVSNRKLSCEETKHAHPRAKVAVLSLRQLFAFAGAR